MLFDKVHGYFSTQRLGFPQIVSHLYGFNLAKGRHYVSVDVAGGVVDVRNLVQALTYSKSGN